MRLPRLSFRVSSLRVGFIAVALAFEAGACGGTTPSGGVGGISAGTGGSAASGGSFGTGGSAASAGSGGASGGGGAAGTGATGTKCSFTFDVTTLNDYGTYSPYNVEAAWIMGPGNKFIRTLELHGYYRTIHLVNWNAASHGNQVDAVTGATLYSQPQTHHDTWDCTDVNGNVVPNGAYNVYVEFTSNDTAYGYGPSEVTHVGFQVGSPQNLNPPNQRYFTNMHLVLK